MNTDSKLKIQNIFNDTITQIIELTTKSISVISNPCTDEKTQPSIALDEDKAAESHNIIINIAPGLSTQLIPVLQTFLMNIQIYHTQVFNGLVNGVAAQVSSQSFLTQDIQQPSVTNKWASSSGNTISTDHLGTTSATTSNSYMSEFGESIDSSNTSPSWPMQRERVSDYWNTRQQANSAASLETRQHWGSRSMNNSPPHGGRYSNSGLQNPDDYDAFLQNYTAQYDNYNTTYVQDSSDDETWKSLDEYTRNISLEPVSLSDSKIAPNLSASQPGNDNHIPITGGDTTTATSDMQCCARLSKYMKYNISNQSKDLPYDFLDSYPPDVYIENGYVFGKPCSNRVSQSMIEADIHFCDEHKFDKEVEDIRQPRSELNTTHINNDEQIVFQNHGYTTDRFDYVDGRNQVTTQYGNILDGNTHNGNTHDGSKYDSFSEGIQCCARLNKFRKYRLDVELDSFLDTYPPDVYIDSDGCIYGCACQNLISDDSAKAGIKFCIEHQSDPYVENICEPSGTRNFDSTRQINNAKYLLPSPSRNTNNNSNHEAPSSASTTRQSSLNSGKINWELEKYNDDFNYLT